MATFEEYIIEQMQKPLTLKGGQQVTDDEGNVLTKEQAIATNLINKALKGDIPAIQYINGIKQLQNKIKK